MNVRDLFTGTLHALWANKVRTLLTMFGIAWGIVSITLMVAGEGLRAGRQLRWLDTDHVFVAREATAYQYVLPELGRGAIPQL